MAIVYPYVQSRPNSRKSTRENAAGSLCQHLAVEAALNKPLFLPLMVLDKFLLGTLSPSNDGFGKSWLQDSQVVSCTYKKWMFKLMPRLTGWPIHTKEDLVAYVQREFAPIQPEWLSHAFDLWQRWWFFATTRAGIPWPGQVAGTPGIPLFYLLGGAGMLAGVLRPGPLRKYHIAWIITLAFTGSVVMLTGVVNPRYRFVFEPFALLYLFLLADTLVALVIRRPVPVGAPTLPQS